MHPLLKLCFQYYKIETKKIMNRLQWMNDKSDLEGLFSSLNWYRFLNEDNDISFNNTTGNYTNKNTSINKVKKLLQNHNTFKLIYAHCSNVSAFDNTHSANVYFAFMKQVGDDILRLDYIIPCNTILDTNEDNGVRIDIVTQNILIRMSYKSTQNNAKPIFFNSDIVFRRTQFNKLIHTKVDFLCKLSTFIYHSLKRYQFNVDPCIDKKIESHLMLSPIEFSIQTMPDIFDHILENGWPTDMEEKLKSQLVDSILKRNNVINNTIVFEVDCIHDPEYKEEKVMRNLVDLVNSCALDTDTYVNYIKAVHEKVEGKSFDKFFHAIPSEIKLLVDWRDFKNTGSSSVMSERLKIKAVDVLANPLNTHINYNTDKRSL